MRIVIFDGLDNTGKSTQINLLKKNLEDKQLRVYVQHFTKPDSNMTNAEKACYQDMEYLNFIKQLILFKCNDMYDYVLIDRCWYSEYVYGQIYRERDEFDAYIKNNMFEDNLMNYFKDDELYLLMFTADSEFLIRHEDGLSLSKNDIQKIQLESHFFHLAYVYSNIKHKKFVYANANERYYENPDSINGSICKFIKINVY